MTPVGGSAPTCLLALADGTVFRGRSLGSRGETFGEMVFNTGLTGYQEVLTDPSYHGQIVAMTYPHQGNYGLNDLDGEAPHPWVRGFVVRHATKQPSSWRSTESLPNYLERHGVVGIEGIDTRQLTRRLREHGAMNGGISSEDTDPASLIERVRAAPKIVGRDLVREVSPASAYDLDPQELWDTSDLTAVDNAPDPRVAGAKVAALDLGMKRNILRCLAGLGFTTRVFGAAATAEEIREWGPDGVFVSNGPGDPAAVPHVAQTLRKLLEARVATFGICLGHQVLGTALGGSTYKLKFGHRGANHPVKSMETGRVEITTQNHGFAVSTGLDPSTGGEAWRALSTSKGDDWVWSSGMGEVALSHFDLNDGTLEGLRCLDVPAYSVQYHPEAAPGPHDSRFLFGAFADLIAANG
ncbi:MAG: glutamine-hydrolyzing carbamoyl-phosphate synthase small subunit [Actinomycetota bacterium]